MAPVQVLSELAAVHASGHDHVGEQEIGHAAVLDHLDGTPGILGGDNAIAEGGELARARGAHQDIVLDQQDSLSFNRGSRCRDNWRAQTNFCHVIARPRRAAPCTHAWMLPRPRRRQ
jgi:hypothetical protein